MGFPFLKVLIAVEVLLACLTVFLYLDTRDEGGFAGLVILLSMTGMAAIGLLAFVIYVLQVFGSNGEAQTARSKIAKLGGLFIFGIPVYYMLGSITGDQPLIAQFLLVFMIMLGMYILIRDKLGDWRKSYEILLLLFAPLLSLIFAFSFSRADDFRWVVMALVIGFGILGIGSVKILRRR